MDWLIVTSTELAKFDLLLTTRVADAICFLCKAVNSGIMKESVQTSHHKEQAEMILIHESAYVAAVTDVPLIEMPLLRLLKPVVPLTSVPMKQLATSHRSTSLLVLSAALDPGGVGHHQRGLACCVVKHLKRRDQKAAIAPLTIRHQRANLDTVGRW